MLNSFLTDPILQNLDRKHVRVALGPKFGMGNRMGYTALPLQFDNPQHPSKVAMYWTDNKSKWRHDFLTLDDLKHGHPSKKGVEVLVLYGDLRGQVFKVDKVTKSNATVTFVHTIQHHCATSSPCLFSRTTFGEGVYLQYVAVTIVFR